MVCVYSFPNGDVVRGKPALKAYLTANLATLLPERAAALPAFKRTPIQSATSQAVMQANDALEATAKSLSARWANAPKIVVASDMNDPRIPAAVREEDQRQRSNGATGEPEGFYYQGTAYLISSQLQTPEDAARVLFHEGLGHYGLRGVFGEALNAVLQQVVALRKADVLAKAKSYGLDPANPEHMLQAAEEVLAEMAQTKPTSGFVQRAIAAIRTWLRQNVPGFAALKLSDAEIIEKYIIPARTFVEQGARAGKDKAAAAFSREESQTAQAILAELSKADDLFANSKSDATTVEGIASDLSKDIEASKTAVPGRTQYDLIYKDDQPATLSVRPFNRFGKTAYSYDLVDGEMRNIIDELPGENPEDVPAKEEVWIDVSKFKVGSQGGELVYQIAANYAHNTGKLFIGDPAGLSDEALRRRTEQMLSSALKFGTTEHLVPHPRQVDGDAKIGVPALRWVYGDDIGNINRMIDVSLTSLENSFPTIKLIAYDPVSDKFYRTDTGEKFGSTGELATRLERSVTKTLAGRAGSTGQAGWRTIARYALFAQLRTAQGGEVLRDGSRLLDALRQISTGARRGQRAEVIGKTPILYSRSGELKTDTAAFKKWFGDSQMVDANGKPMVVYHATNQDITAFDPAMDKRGNGLIFFAKSAENAEGTIASDYRTTSVVIPTYLSVQKLFSGADGVPAATKQFIRDNADKIGEDISDYRAEFGLASSADAYYESGARNVNGVIKTYNFNPEAYAKAIKTGEWQAVEASKTFIQHLKDEGYDGIKFYEDGDTYAVFKPTQIKSATGNNGEYSSTNPDIRFSRSTKPATEADAGLTPPEQGLLRRVQSVLQDNMNRVRQVQERLMKLTGKPIQEQSNYYGAETNRPGRIAARLETAELTMTKPLMERLAKSGHTPEQLGELLHAMHAQERNERVASINPEMPDGGSGMTTAEAKAILTKFKHDSELHRLANEARALAKTTLDLKLAYGLIDAQTHEALATIYKNYVPLKGDGEFGPKIKRAMGHEEREEHILENIARDYNQAVVVGEKNLARQSLLSMVLENPDPQLWTVGIPPRGRFVAGKVYSVFKNGEEVATFTSGSQVAAFLEGKGAQAINYEVKDSGGDRVQEFVKPLQDNEVMVYVEGQGVRIQIKDEQLARQLKPLDQGHMNPILEFLRKVNRYLSKIYTGYNPAFIIRNTARDAMTGTINIMGNEGAGIAAQAWKNYPAALKALTSYAIKHKEPAGETGTYLKEYRMHGGKVGASWMSDLEEHGKKLQTMFDDAYGAKGYAKDGKYGKASLIAGRKIVGGMAHVIEVANQATENGLRLALFIAMREQGKSPGEAAQAAKGVTVDFDRKGSMTGALGAIYLFFNPAVQGTANAIKTLVKGNKKEQAWMALGALAMLGLYAASQGMDDDKDRWLGEGWESRSKNLILNIGGYHLKVPTSMEFAPFYAFGVAMGEMMRGESKMAAAGHLVSSFLDAYFPLQGAFSSESDNHGLDAVGAVMPTIIKPGFQIAVNRNSFGSQVVPENEFTKDRPDNLKMFKGTKGSAYDAAAQGIASAGEALGAGRYENDLSKVSPETLKMLWRTYTGGLGQFVTDAAGLANIGARDGGNLEPSDVPIVKDFVKPNNVAAIRSRFYDLSKDARAASEEFKQAKKAGDGDAMDAILNRPEKAELLGLDKLITKTTKAASAIRDEMVSINADQALSLSEKREKLKALEKDEEALYRDAIAAFK